MSTIDCAVVAGLLPYGELAHLADAGWTETQ